MDRPFQSRLEKADQILSEMYEGRHLTGFRDDVEEIWVENRTDCSWDINSEQVASDVRRSIEYPRQQLLTIENGVNKLQIFDGITGGVLAFLLYSILTHLGITWITAVGSSVFVFLFFTMMNHSILYKKAIVNRACYLRASSREADSRLLFKRGWNAKVLSSNSSVIGILLVALARRLWRGAYEIGLDRLQELDREKNC